MGIGEFELIDRYFARQQRRGDVRVGIGDDAAVLEMTSERKLVVAMDTLVDGVHFPRQASPNDIGYRALAVNLSDIAAMGAVPAWFTLSLSLPKSDEAWVKQFAAGLFELANAYDVMLVGGDTVKGPLVITVQIGGWVEADRWLARSGARPGDHIMVSGSIGDAAAGLRAIQTSMPSSGSIEALRARFLRPTPRVQLGREMRQIASAAMDVSDGLLADLDKLCGASGCGAVIDVDTLPLSDALRSSFDQETQLNFALSGGDDYELLLAIPPEHAARAEQLGCTRIGVATADRHVWCRRGSEEFTPTRRGYDHFDKDRAG